MNKFFYGLYLGYIHSILRKIDYTYPFKAIIREDYLTFLSLIIKRNFVLPKIYLFIIFS